MTTEGYRRKNLHISVEALCSRYLSSRAVTRQVLSAHVSLTSVFGMGSEPSAAGGRESEVNEWQGSVSDAAAPSARRAPGTPTGNRWTRPSFPQVQRIATPVCAPVRNDNGGVQTKKPPHFCGGFVLALPIFPGSRPPSIVGACELNFCVRDGNRWTLTAINTNYSIVQLALLQPLVTRTGFEPMLTA